MDDEIGTREVCGAIIAGRTGIAGRVKIGGCVSA
jgi:hypothetical protein